MTNSIYLECGENESTEHDPVEWCERINEKYSEDEKRQIVDLLEDFCDFLDDE